MTELTLDQREEWQALEQEAADLSTRHLRDLFAGDHERARKFSGEAAGLFADYSKNLITEDTLDKLLALARASQLEARRDAMFAGEPINETEKRAVLHVALRGGPDAQFAAAGDVVYFDSDSSELSPAAKATLRRQVRWLRAHPDHRILVEGHADERGTRDYNLALGERRANAAKNYLVSLGVSADRIRTVSYGKERPVALASNAAAWAQNRRAASIIIN